MGEITEALRRARERSEAEGREPRAPEAPAPRPSVAPPPEPTRVAPPPAPDPPPAAEPAPVAPMPALRPPRGEDDAAPMAHLNRERRGFWQPRAIEISGEGAAAESFRQLALRVRRELAQRGSRSVAVVSALRQEGKTTVAFNLALAAASLTRSRAVALVDLDLRKPSVARTLDLRVPAGVEAVLRGETRASRVCVPIDQPALDVYPVASAQQEAQRLLVQPGLQTLVRELEQRYEIVVFDTPPVIPVPDAAVILQHVATYLAVARAGRTSTRAFSHMSELLPAGKAIGAVLNEGRLPLHARHYGYYSDDLDDLDAS